MSRQTAKSPCKSPTATILGDWDGGGAKAAQAATSATAARRTARRRRASIGNSQANLVRMGRLRGAFVNKGSRSSKLDVTLRPSTLGKPQLTYEGLRMKLFPVLLASAALLAGTPAFAQRQVDTIDTA